MSRKEFNERELMSGSEIGKKTFASINSESGKVWNVLAPPKFQSSDLILRELSLKGDCQILCMLVCISYKEKVFEGLLVLLRLSPTCTTASLLAPLGWELAKILSPMEMQLHSKGPKVTETSTDELSLTSWLKSCHQDYWTICLSIFPRKWAWLTKPFPAAG